MLLNFTFIYFCEKIKKCIHFLISLLQRRLLYCMSFKKFSVHNYLYFQTRAGLVKPCRLPTPVPVVQISDRTLVHQESLPKLPVPPLNQTCARYLGSLEPLLCEEEMAHTRKLMKEFLRPGGVGERLQKSLERRARKTENWVRWCAINHFNCIHTHTFNTTHKISFLPDRYY